MRPKCVKTLFLNTHTLVEQCVLMHMFYSEDAVIGIFALIRTNTVKISYEQEPVQLEPPEIIETR